MFKKERLILSKNRFILSLFLKHSELGFPLIFTFETAQKS